MKKNDRKPSRKSERGLFETIRKPVAPPGHPLSHVRPEERVHPAERKAKHKRREDASEATGKGEANE